MYILSSNFKSVIFSQPMMMMMMEMYGCWSGLVQQLAHPTPTMFTFPSQASNDGAPPSLSVCSPAGTGRPSLTSNVQPSPLSPSRGYCPAMRGPAPAATTSSAAGVVGGLAGVGSLAAPGAGGASARSPSVNRLGSLFNSINRSVTSAFSNFVAVNQPVPGVIQDYDQSSPA